MGAVGYFLFHVSRVKNSWHRCSYVCELRNVNYPTVNLNLPKATKETDRVIPGVCSPSEGEERTFIQNNISNWSK